VGGVVAAFDGPSLDIFADEIAWIVAPSDCGKTTLVRFGDGLLPRTRDHPA
jgi:energy-coupling factor transporter ATP-binding protein EcfA2